MRSELASIARAVATTLACAAASVAVAQDHRGPLTRADQIKPAIGKCWKPPEGLLVFEEIQITARFSLKRNGELIGTPRVTFSTMPPETKARQMLTDATLAAIARCTPLDLSETLGHSIAGKMINFRFIYRGRKGRET